LEAKINEHGVVDPEAMYKIKNMVLRHHVLYAIHHKLTSDLPRIFTTNLRNPPQKPLQ
jgi:hypothetical protein